MHCFLRITYFIGNFLFSCDPWVMSVTWSLLFLVALGLLLYYIRSKKFQYKKVDSFRNLILNAKDIIYTTNAFGEFEFINQATLNSTGYKREELIGKNYKILIKDDFKRQVESFYKSKIKEGAKESYNEFPFSTKFGETLWVGQSVLYYYNEHTGAYIGAQVICRDISVRAEIEAKLKLHNSDLKVINQVKEIILTSNDMSNMYVRILLLLGINANQSKYFTINIFDKFQNVLHTYSLSTRDQSVKSNSNSFDPTGVSKLNNMRDIFDLESDPSLREFLKKLNQPGDSFNSAVVVSIMGGEKLYGFIGFFSDQVNVYNEDHLLMVADISSSLSSFYVQYEQQQLINEYSKQLEILNESKSLLLSYNNLNNLYRGMIDLLYHRIKHVYRVSILIHDLEKNIGNIFFKDLKSPEISSKLIKTDKVPTIGIHLKGEIFERKDLQIETELSEEDKIWLSKGVRSVISLPITVEGKLYASVNLLSLAPNNFTKQQKTLITEINKSAAIVIEQLRLKEIIAEKSKDISDNINYARRIQIALMPSENFLRQILPQSFLLFEQRDSLGGDFYWFDKIDSTVFLCVGDCTGHGVSGSLLTILAIDYLKQAIEDKKFKDPGLILEHLRNAFQATLNKYNKEEEILDGLDISFGVYDEVSKTFLFASAMHHFYLIRNNELTEYKGNRKPIGGSAIMESSYYFTTHLFQLKENDVIYFVTDGYTDQLDSKNEKRFGKSRFKQLLLEICDQESSDQKEILIREHMTWKGNSSQTDDICLLGFKV